MGMFDRLRTVTALLLAVLTACNAFWTGTRVAPPPPPGAKTRYARGARFRNWWTSLPRPASISLTPPIPTRSTSWSRWAVGVLVLDYDRDGWPDIYFTNAPTVAMALKDRPHAARFTTTITTAHLPTSPTRLESRLRVSPWAERSAITTTTAGPIWRSPASGILFCTRTMATEHSPT